MGFFVFWHIIRPQPISAVAQWCTGTGRLISVGLAIRETVVDVLTVRSGVREALQTFGTLERLLTGMKSTMFRQVMFVLESLVAVGTLVRTCICKKKHKDKIID